MSSLLQPLSVHDSLEFRNRICMGSMTRNRCTLENMPTEATSEHYAARARDGAGLIVAEGTFVYLNGAEWPHAPLMYTPEHRDAWKPVTQKVHEAGGKIFFQPWHPGRIQNEGMPMMKNTGYPVYAPSSIPAAGGKFRILSGIPGHTKNLTEIQNPEEIIEQYRVSVRLAKEAGFDGIELLSQGGYLLHNFLNSNSNKRTDQYGGSVENRCRFPLQVLDAILTVWDARFVGIKICPSDDYNDTAVSEEEMKETYTYYIKELMKRELLFINLSRRGAVVAWNQDDYFKTAARPPGREIPHDYNSLKIFGGLINYPGSPTLLMVNHEYTIEEADDLIKQEKIDLVCFGRPFIYNPDLVSRVAKGIALSVNTRGGTVNYGPYDNVNQNYNDWPAAS